jgi:hypothetical protein
MIAKMRSAGQHNIISIARDDIHFCQSLSGGVLLSQIIYWANVTEQKFPEREGWFYKTYQEWMEEICLPEKTIRWFIAQFERLGFLETKTKKNPQGNPVKHYRFLPDMFEPLYVEFLETGSPPVPAQRQKGNGQESNQPNGSFDPAQRQFGSGLKAGTTIYTSLTTSLTLIKEGDDNPQQSESEEDLKIPIPESPPQNPLPVNSAFASSTATEIPPQTANSPPPPTPAPAAAARQQAAARLEEAQWGTPDLPTWRTGRGRNEWNEPIVEGVRLWLESLAKGGKRTRADAIAYIAKRESPISVEHDSLLARVDEIKSQLNAKGSGSSVRSSADGMTSEEREAYMEAEFKRQSAARQISA